MSGAISSSVLLGWYQSFFGGNGTGTSTSLVTAGNTGTGTTTPTILYAPTAPWNENAQPSQNQRVQSALGGASLFNPAAAQLDLANAGPDYKNLFALYSGLQTLYSVAQAAGAKNIPALKQTQLANAFSNGMAQLSKYLGQTSFNNFKLTAGTVQESQTSTVSTPSQATHYVTPALNTTGDSSAVAPAFEGDVQFTVTTTVNNTVKTINMNLNDLGSAPRTMANVLTYLNGQMRAAGAIANFSSNLTPAVPDTINVNGKTVTIDPGKASWGLKLNTNPIEQVTLSAPTTSNAVYIGQVVGNTTATGTSSNPIAADAQSQLLKFDPDSGLDGPTAPAHATGDQIFTIGLGATTLSSIQSTAVSSDGSVYALANVTVAPNGSAPAGGQDVALLKYDSAGKLLFSTDLGSVTSASGLSLAVSADGSQVAIAGSVTGSMTAGQTVLDPKGANSFVAVYDNDGDQVWTQQDDGINPNQATGVAFGADGSVYVTGQSQTSTAVQGAGGPSNSFLQVFSTTGKQIANTQIATGGSNTSNGIAVDGTNTYVAGVQNGHAVVSEYDMTDPKAPVLVATRDLGDLQGGNVVGVGVENGQVYVAGSARGGSLNAGTVTSAASAGLDTFAATLSTGLAPSGSDAVAYYGGAGDDRATGMTVSGGDVWITGTSTGDLPGQPAIGAQDGFVAALNVSSGQADYTQRFTGLDGKVAPVSISVDPGGASVLDQLGLPTGDVDAATSNLITATTGVKAGDSFQISANGASPITVKVLATDTFASLATRISQATGFTVNVSTSPGVNGSTALEIKPAYSGATVKLINGPTGTDALSELGLKPGVVTDTASKNGVTVLAGSNKPIYGLGLPPTLDLKSAADIKQAQVQLAGAVSVVEQAYQNLRNAATPAAVLALQKAQSSGAGTPKYLSDQIANYQSALTRLTAGSGSTGTTSLSALL